MPIENEVGEQQPPLPSGECLFQAVTVDLYDERPADLDPDGWLQGSGNLAVQCFPTQPIWEVVVMERIIRCECGFVARADTDEKVIERIRDHMREDHPELLQQIATEDLLSWIEVK